MKLIDKFGVYEVSIDYEQKCVWITNNELYEANNTILIDFEELDKVIDILKKIKEEL